MALAEDQVAEAFARAWASWWGRRSKDAALGDQDIKATGGPGASLDTAVLTALRRLPSRQREVTVLRIFLDLDIDTTARQLGIAPGTVRAHLSRGSIYPIMV